MVAVAELVHSPTAFSLSKPGYNLEVTCYMLLLAARNYELRIKAETTARLNTGQP